MSRYDNVVLADSPTRYHKCDETSGTAWVDSSTNASNGTISPANLDAWVSGTDYFAQSSVVQYLGVGYYCINDNSDGTFTPSNWNTVQVLYQQPSLITSALNTRSLRQQGDGAFCIPSSINYSTTMTIEFWVTWADTWENEGAIPSSPTNGQHGLLRRDITQGSLQYFGGIGPLDNNYYNDINPTLINVKNRPYYVVLTWGSNSFNLWINAIHQTTIGSDHAFTSTNPPQFGSQSLGLQWCWDGLIQNVAIYNGVKLPTARILEHYKVGSICPFGSFSQ